MQNFKIIESYLNNNFVDFCRELWESGSVAWLNMICFWKVSFYHWQYVPGLWHNRWGNNVSSSFLHGIWHGDRENHVLFPHKLRMLHNGWENNGFPTYVSNSVAPFRRCLGLLLRTLMNGCKVAEASAIGLRTHTGCRRAMSFRLLCASSAGILALTRLWFAGRGECLASRRGHLYDNLYGYQVLFQAKSLNNRSSSFFFAEQAIG